jgi:hypothetical protein
MFMTQRQLFTRPLRTFDQACKDTGYNPTMHNCMPGKRLRDPSVFAVFEVRPCYDDNGYTQSCEHEPWLADFWTVYGARDASWREWEAITDVSTEKLAHAVVCKLVEGKLALLPKPYHERMDIVAALFGNVRPYKIADS